MERFYRGVDSPRQVRGRRKVKPAGHQERLESMNRELANRVRIYGPDHWMTKEQQKSIEEEGKR